MYAGHALARVQAHYEELRKADPTLLPWRKLTRSQQRKQMEAYDPPVFIPNATLGAALRKSSL